MRKLIELLIDYLIKRAERTGNVFQITGGKGSTTVYLQRYIAFKSKLFGCVYIHRFLRSDADDPHDHPWNFFTYVISGGYTEHYYDKSKAQYNEHGSITDYWTAKIIRRTPGSLRYRRALDIHKVQVDEEIDYQVGEYAPEKLARAPLTICIMGPRVREWGFWSLDGRTFTDWRSYLNIMKGDPRIEGGE